MKKSTKTLMKLVGLIAFILLAVYIGRYTNFSQYLDKELITSFGVWAPLIFILVYIMGAVLFVPGTVLTLIGALVFGTWFGTLYTVIGATIGASAAFLIARYAGREFIAKLLKGKLVKFDKGIEKNGLKVTLVLRLIPVFPFNVLNFGLGLTKVKLKHYVIGTFIGIIPATFIYTYLFATLGEKILTDGFSFADVLTMNVLVPLSLFLLLIIMPLVFRKRFHRVKKEYIKH